MICLNHTGNVNTEKTWDLLWSQVSPRRCHVFSKLNVRSLRKFPFPYHHCLLSRTVAVKVVNRSMFCRLLQNVNWYYKLPQETLQNRKTKQLSRSAAGLFLKAKSRGESTTWDGTVRTLPEKSAMGRHLNREEKGNGMCVFW